MRERVFNAGPIPLRAGVYPRIYVLARAHTYLRVRSSARIRMHARPRGRVCVCAGACARVYVLGHDGGRRRYMDGRMACVRARVCVVCVARRESP